MRITQQTMTALALDRLQGRLRQLSDAQGALARGTVLARPSDDPAAMNRALGLRGDQAATEQSLRNGSDGLRWIALADSKLRTLLDRLHRARELAVRAGSVTNPAERSAIATEIRAIREETVAIANSESGGRGLFAGFAPGPAVVQVAGVWTYQGDAGQVTRRVGEGDVVTVNVTGDEVFGFGAGNDLFSALDQLAARVAADDDAGVQVSITDIDAARDRILSGLARLGAATNRIEAAQQRAEEAALEIRQQLGQLESVDLAEAITDLRLQEVAFEATLGVLSRSLQPSLVRFLI
jgi:flagellar hook-associated protein 3 FlgL